MPYHTADAFKSNNARGNRSKDTLRNLKKEYFWKRNSDNVKWVDPKSVESESVESTNKSDFAADDENNTSTIQTRGRQRSRSFKTSRKPPNMSEPIKQKINIRFRSSSPPHKSLVGNSVRDLCCSFCNPKFSNIANKKKSLNNDKRNFQLHELDDYLFDETDEHEYHDCDYEE